VSFKYTLKSRRNGVLHGAGTLSYDQNMRNHRIKSDREAFASDRDALRHDLAVAWYSAKPRELDAA
jgi:hypothetical protein